MESKKLLFILENPKTIKIREPNGIYKIKDPKPQSYFEQFEDVDSLYESDLDISEVKIVKHPETGKESVLKKIFKDSLISQAQKNQATIEFPLQSVLKHENIVQCYEYGESEDEWLGLLEAINRPYYLTETIDEELMHIESETQLKAFMADILAGLDYLHSNGVIHADIKLDNILAQEIEGSLLPTLKICDFGLAQIEDEEGGAYIKQKMGTVNYIAPEVKKNSRITNKVDIWSLGICLYKMCCAYRPSQVRGYRYGTGPIPFRKFDWKNRSEELKDLVTKMLEFEPEKRISVKEAINHPWFHVES